MKPTFVLAAMLFVFLVTIIEPAAAAHAESDERKNNSWSAEVNGLKACIVLKRTRVINGTPIISTYLMLRNVSDVMNPMSIPWDHKLIKFRVVDAQGNELRTPAFDFSGPVLVGTVTLVLPIRGELSFDYSSSGCGVPGDKAALICLGLNGSWIIEPNQGDFFLHAIIEVAESKPLREEPTLPWHGRIELPPVRIPLEGEPMDAATIEARVNKFGPMMLDKNYRLAEEAERAMSLIDDPRVIVWYLRALDMNRYGLKMRALDRLSRFEDDQAFEALKRAITTRGEDIGSASRKEVADDLAENIRHSAANALSRSPHPEAKPLLMTMWNHPDQSVRITVLHALGRVDTPESLELLKKMGADRDDRVRNEAVRYLKLRGHEVETEENAN